MRQAIKALTGTVLGIGGTTLILWTFYLIGRYNTLMGMDPIESTEQGYIVLNIMKGIVEVIIAGMFSLVLICLYKAGQEVMEMLGIEDWIDKHFR